jgi:hypothetical protein
MSFAFQCVNIQNDDYFHNSPAAYIREMLASIRFWFHIFSFPICNSEQLKYPKFLILPCPRKAMKLLSFSLIGQQRWKTFESTVLWKVLEPKMSKLRKW